LGGHLIEFIGLPIDLEHNVARGGFDHAHDTFHQRTFAVAIGPQERHSLSVGNLHAHALQCSDRPVASVHVIDGEFNRQGKPFARQDF